MEINDKKLTRTKKLINWTISIVLAIFLILLSEVIIGDLDNTVDYPVYTDYVEKVVDEDLQNKEKKIQSQLDEQLQARSTVFKMISSAEELKESEQESFDNWLAARKTLAKPEQDPEVMKRLKKLDEYRDVVKAWRVKGDSIGTIISTINAQIYEVNQEQAAQRKVADEKLYSARNSYDIRVFLIRLLFVLPILALGIFFFIRYRKHKFSPFFMGFTLFSVYAFFVGLVPYLPSYGGYIRYTVGVLLTIGLGYYAIKKLKDYSDRKSAELKASTTDRAKRMHTDIAEKAFNSGVCPSCGKSFLMKNWEMSLNNVDFKAMKPSVTKYCRFCGMQIVKPCENCGVENYAHLPFCLGCGKSLKNNE